MLYLVIYDSSNGTLVGSNVSGEYYKPLGPVKAVEIDVPNGQRVIRMDISTTPHKAVFSEPQKDVVAEELAALKAANITQRNMNITMLKAMAEVYEAFLVYMNQ